MSDILAIIGTAGRTEAERTLLTLARWNDMKRTIYRFVKDRGYTSVISGGSAYADHLAVGLFNAGHVSHLTLALPCAFDWESACFVDRGELWNPAARLNQLHGQFARVIGKSSLQEIKTALYKGAEVATDNGFLARNSIVAKQADVVIALTFGKGREIAEGGTADTCRKYLARGGKSLFHVDLQTMTLYENGKVS